MPPNTAMSIILAIYLLIMFCTFTLVPASLAVINHSPPHPQLIVPSQRRLRNLPQIDRNAMNRLRSLKSTPSPLSSSPVAPTLWPGSHPHSPRFRSSSSSPTSLPRTPSPPFSAIPTSSKSTMASSPWFSDDTTLTTASASIPSHESPDTWVADPTSSATPTWDSALTWGSPLTTTRNHSDSNPSDPVGKLPRLHPSEYDYIGNPDLSADFAREADTRCPEIYDGPEQDWAEVNEYYFSLWRQTGCEEPPYDGADWGGNSPKSEDFTIEDSRGDGEDDEVAEAQRQWDEDEAELDDGYPRSRRGWWVKELQMGRQGQKGRRWGWDDCSYYQEAEGWDDEDGGWKDGEGGWEGGHEWSGGRAGGWDQGSWGDDTAVDVPGSGNEPGKNDVDAAAVGIEEARSEGGEKGVEKEFEDALDRCNGRVHQMLKFASTRLGEAGYWPRWMNWWWLDDEEGEGRFEREEACVEVLDGWIQRVKGMVVEAGEVVGRRGEIRGEDGEEIG